MDGADVVTPGHTRPPGILYIRKKNTKIKVSPLTGIQIEKKYVFRNPRDAIKNFCYALKKLPDLFNVPSKRALILM